MESLLQTIVVSQVYAFIIIFVRLGTAVMIMPGIGDGFVPERVRLMFALSFSAVLTPIIGPLLPVLPVGGAAFLLMVMGEFMIGVFIGMVARIFMTALDTAGMLISTQMGLANAQIFNPAMATQGSVMGAFLSITGAVLLMATNMHHVMLEAILDSYKTFPAGALPATWQGDFATVIGQAVNDAFAIGFQFSVPFMVVMMMVYVAMGVLSRVMPQLQVFMLSMPIQIILGFLTLALVLAAGMMFWLSHYEQALQILLPQTGR